MLYICTTFREHFCNDFKIIVRTNFQSKKKKKKKNGQNSVNNTDGVKVLIFCIMSEDALYL